MLMEIDFLRRSARFLRPGKNRNVISENMYIKNSVLDYIRYKQFNWNGRVRKMKEERLPRKNFGMVSTWKRKKKKKKKKKRMTSKFLNANWNEREGN